MKNLIIVICFLLTSSAFAELTPEDILTISNIVEKSEERLRTYIDTTIIASEKRTREYIDIKLDGTEGKLTARMDGTDRNITLIVTLLVGVMALIVLAVGIPQLILVSRQRNQHAMEKRLNEMQDEMKQFRKEVALLLEEL